VGETSFFLLTDKPTIFRVQTSESRNLPRRTPIRTCRRLGDYVEAPSCPAKPSSSSAQIESRFSHRLDHRKRSNRVPENIWALRSPGVRGSLISRRPTICSVCAPYFHRQRKGKFAAWTGPRGRAPRPAAAAGVIHSDFEPPAFIKAETVAYDGPS